MIKQSKLVRLLLYVLLILLPAQYSQAAEFIEQEIDEFLPAKPAHLTNKRKSLQNRIQFPNIDGEVFVVLLCNGIVNERGRFDDEVFCLQDSRVDQVFNMRGEITQASRSIEVDADVDVTEVVGVSAGFVEDRFEREVVEAARVARIKPAWVAGRTVPVNINFAVIFEKSNGEESIDVYMHHFWNMDRYGAEYISAQLLGTLMDDELLGMADECPIIENPIWIKSAVNTEGFPGEVTLNEVLVREDVSSNTEDRCIDVYLMQAEKNFYVPAIYKGTYVNSYHSGLVYQPATSDFDVDVNRESDAAVRNAQSKPVTVRGFLF